MALERIKEVSDYLTDGKYPEGYNRTQKLTLKRYCQKFTLKDGQLLYGDRKVVRSKDEARSLFIEYHASPYRGHTGMVRTRKAICSRFYWVGMSRDIDKWVAECDGCQGRTSSSAGAAAAAAAAGGQPLKTKKVTRRKKVTETMVAVCFDYPCGPEKLYVGKVPRPQPKAREIFIKIHATALNRADLLQRRGLYPAPPGESQILGLEAAGVIAALGVGVRGQWFLGQQVMALLSGGGYAEFVSVPEELVMPIPPHLTIIQSAAIPEAWLTAFQLIHLVAKVQPGEMVLVHAGASGVGTAAIQLLRLTQAIPVATAGTAEKLEMTKSVGAAAAFNYKTENFAERVNEFTSGRGADVILDCVGGSCWQKNVQCLAMDGRWVLYGAMGGKSVDGDLLGKLLAKRGQLLCSLLRSRSLQYKAELVRAFSEKALPHFEASMTLRPVIDCVFSLQNIAEAHRHMEDNKNMGKIVIEVMKGDCLQAEASAFPPSTSTSTSTSTTATDFNTPSYMNLLLNQQF